MTRNFLGMKNPHYEESIAQFKIGDIFRPIVHVGAAILSGGATIPASVQIEQARAQKKAAEEAAAAAQRQAEADAAEAARIAAETKQIQERTAAQRASMQSASVFPNFSAFGASPAQASIVPTFGVPTIGTPGSGAGASPLLIGGALVFVVLMFILGRK